MTIPCTVNLILIILIGGFDMGERRGKGTGSVAERSPGTWRVRYQAPSVNGQRKWGAGQKVGQKEDGVIQEAGHRSN